MGLHFVNFPLVADGKIDAAKPEIVLYEPTSSGRLRITGAVFLVFAAVSLFLFPFVGRDFFPTVDAGQLRLHVRAPAGTRIEETERYFQQVEDYIRQVIPARELAAIADNIGVPNSINLALSLRKLGKEVLLFDADLGLAVPSYTFAQPFLGGQATVLMLVPYGRSQASVDGTLTGNLGLGGPGFAVSGGRADEIDGFGDLGPQFNLRWNNGVHNYMTYVATNIPIGRYDATRLANLGIGHNAVDAGGGYTYFNPQTGREFSAVLGFTYNFENAHTQYQNGIDAHLDWGASQFLTKQVQLGLVGYAYQQLSCDSGAGDRVGCFESRVFGIGPQVGYILPLGTMHQAYFNLKGYKEFGAEHRPEGWNVWFTVAISPLAAPPPASKPMAAR